MYFLGKVFVTNVSIILEMKLSLATATLIPNEAYENNGVKALAQNSVDGLSRIGESGANGGQKCAGLKLQNVSRLLECLRIDLGHRQQVYAIRLHLRDGRDIFEKQKGMIVSINDDYLTPSFSDNCGSYDPADGQSPEFYCKNSSARYVWMSTTKYPKWPLFICEVEVYAGGMPVRLLQRDIFVVISSTITVTLYFRYSVLDAGKSSQRKVQSDTPNSRRVSDTVL